MHSCAWPCTRRTGPSATLHEKSPLLSPLPLRSRFRVFSFLPLISHQNTYQTQRLPSEHALGVFVSLTPPTEQPRCEARMTEDALGFPTHPPSTLRFDASARFGGLQGAASTSVNAPQRPSMARLDVLEALRRSSRLFETRFRRVLDALQAGAPSGRPESAALPRAARPRGPDVL